MRQVEELLVGNVGGIAPVVEGSWDPQLAFMEYMKMAPTTIAVKEDELSQPLASCTNGRFTQPLSYGVQNDDSIRIRRKRHEPSILTYSS